MTSTKLQETETVYSLFHNMNQGSEPVDLDVAKNIIKEYRLDIKNTSERHLYKVGIVEETKNFEKLEVDKLVNYLKNRRNDLISILVYLKYTWNNANLIIDTFLDSIKAYQEEFKVVDCSFLCSRYCEMFSSDILLNVRLIAKCIFNSQYLVIRCSITDDLLPFYIYLADLIYNIKLHIIDLKEETVEKETVKEKHKANDGLWSDLLDVKKLEETNREAYLNKCKNSSCPMIITQDADIDAAMDSFKKSICQAQVQSGSTVSHVLIEESIYEQTVLLLENTLTRIRLGSRFDKRTELEAIDNELNVDKTSHLNLKIICPGDKFPIKLCIGWNPQDIDDNSFTKSSGYIPVIPYRNLSELKSLVKGIFQKKICPASIWCENISVIKLQYEFEFSPLWINCHGLMHPLFPHYTPYIYSNEEGFPGKDIALLKRSDPLLALYCAQKDCSDRHLFQAENLEFFLNFLSNSESSAACRIMGCLNQGVKSGIKKMIDSKITLVSEALISNSCEPVGVIIIYLSINNFPCDNICFQRILAASLINGNSVIVVAKDDFTLTSSKNASKLFQPLPDSVLAFLVESDFNPKLLHGRIKSNDTFSCRLLCFGEDLIFQVNNLYDISLIDHTSCFCNKVLYDITSRNRCVWTS